LASARHGIGLERGCEDVERQAVFVTHDLAALSGWNSGQQIGVLRCHRTVCAGFEDAAPRWRRTRRAPAQDARGRAGVRYATPGVSPPFFARADKLACGNTAKRRGIESLDRFFHRELPVCNGMSAIANPANLALATM